MVRHVVMWKLDPQLSSQEKLEVCKRAKAALESLVGSVPGLESLSVGIACEQGGFDMCLVSRHTDLAALRSYAQHPLHVQTAQQFVRPYISERVFCDSEE